MGRAALPFRLRLSLILSIYWSLNPIILVVTLRIEHAPSDTHYISYTYSNISQASIQRLIWANHCNHQLRMQIICDNFVGTMITCFLGICYILYGGYYYIFVCIMCLLAFGC